MILRLCLLLAVQVGTLGLEEGRDRWDPLGVTDKCSGREMSTELDLLEERRRRPFSGRREILLFALGCTWWTGQVRRRGRTQGTGY